MIYAYKATVDWDVEKSDWEDGTRACRITEEVQRLGEKVSVENFSEVASRKRKGA